MKNMIRIASGQGFWGDLVDAPVRQVTEGNVDYLVMDYLAEVTMSILMKQKLKNPLHGYALDIPQLMKRILPACVNKNIKVITNGGGVNPHACARAVQSVAAECGIEGLKIAVITGDDIIDQIDGFISQGILLNNMDTGEPVTEVRNELISANVYLGAMPIAEALRMGADIVITGRTTDTGLTLAPMIYEFGWTETDYDLLAAGTVAGHILECGAQATGGNFLGDWQSVPDMSNIGFPIAEAYPGGDVIITKHESLGGCVSFDTVAEQLIYEIGDPAEYITPDCIADFTTIQLEDQGNNRVRVFGIKGRAATGFYKVSAAFNRGYSAAGALTYSWPMALTKARAADTILRQRLNNLGLSFDEICTEYIGFNACHGPLSAEIPEDSINEIQLRVAVRSDDFDAVDRFGKEIAPLILTGPPSVTGFAGGRPKPARIVAYWPALIPKEVITPSIEII